MERFEVKNTKKMEELINEVGEKYGLELNHIASNFIGGNNAYCGNEILKAINYNALPILSTSGFSLGNKVQVKFYLVLHIDLGEVKTPLYSCLIDIEDVEVYE